jgi:hypothetical protein
MAQRSGREWQQMVNGSKFCSNNSGNTPELREMTTSRTVIDRCPSQMSAGHLRDIFGNREEVLKTIHQLDGKGPFIHEINIHILSSSRGQTISPRHWRTAI